MFPSPVFPSSPPVLPSSPPVLPSSPPVLPPPDPLLPPTALLMAVRRGHFPSPHILPVKSSRSMAHTIQPPYPSFFIQSTFAIRLSTSSYPTHSFPLTTYGTLRSGSLVPFPLLAI